MVYPDHQYDPTVIPHLLQALTSGDYDAAFGSRMLGGRPIQGGMPKWKYLGNILLTAIKNATFLIYLTEYHSGFRAYTRTYLETVNVEANSDGFVFDTEIIAQGMAKGLRICEIQSRRGTSTRLPRSRSDPRCGTASRSSRRCCSTSCTSGGSTRAGSSGSAPPDRAAARRSGLRSSAQPREPQAGGPEGRRLRASEGEMGYLRSSAGRGGGSDKRPALSSAEMRPMRKSRGSRTAGDRVDRISGLIQPARRRAASALSRRPPSM